MHCLVDFRHGKDWCHDHDRHEKEAHRAKARSLQNAWMRQPCQKKRTTILPGVFDASDVGLPTLRKGEITMALQYRKRNDRSRPICLGDACDVEVLLDEHYCAFHKWIVDTWLQRSRDILNRLTSQSHGGHAV